MSKRSHQSRKDAYNLGLDAEWLAKLLLMAKGYRIVAERYQNMFGEIDIVARKGSYLVIIEVKARKSLRDCLESITPQAQDKKIKAAKSLLAYPGELAKHISDPNLAVRFDLICIVPWHLPKHITNAWQAG